MAERSKAHKAKNGPSFKLPKKAAGTENADPGETMIPLITGALDRLTTVAVSLPKKSDLRFHRTLDRNFAKSLDVSSAQLLSLTERLLALVDGAPPVPSKNGTATSSAQKKDKERSKLVDEQDAVEGFKRSAGAVIDGLLEDADSRLDEVSGAKKASAISIDPKKAALASRKLPGPFAPVSAAGSSSTASSSRSRLPQGMMNADIPKPQLSFPDTIDNTPNQPWIPSLTEKQHAMVPLDHPISDMSIPSPPLGLSSEKAAEWRRRKRKEREHPYWFEMEHLPYPTRMFEIAPPIPPVPLDQDQSQLTFVDTVESLEEMVEVLKKAKEIAVDLEHHSLRSYQGFTCLMQISTRERDWVVDTLKLRGEIREGKLGWVLADPNVVKVFHGANSDITWLQQDFDIYVVNLFDTYHATHVLGYSAHSLASLLARFSSFTADKRYQMADWRIRPLPQEMIDYARSDTHYLLNIYDHLRNALLEMSSRPSTPQPQPQPQILAVHTDPGFFGDSTSDPASVNPTLTPTATRPNPQAALRQTLELSAETALRLHEKDEYREDGLGVAGWRGVMKKNMPRSVVAGEDNVNGLLEVEMLKGLHKWRDEVARREDESPFYIMPNSVLAQLALLRAPNTAILGHIISNKKIGAVQHVDEILRVMLEIKELFTAASEERQKILDAGSVTVQSQPQSQVQDEAGPATEDIPKTMTDTAETAVPATLKHAPKPQRDDSESLWSALGPSASTSASMPANTPKSRSTLFGKTIQSGLSSSSVPGASPAAGANKKSKSSSSALFGSTLSGRTSQERSEDISGQARVRAVSPGYLAVQRKIQESISGSTATTAVTPSEQSNLDRDLTTITTEQSGSTDPSNEVIQPETVPFVSANRRSGFSVLKAIAEKGKQAAASRETAAHDATGDEGGVAVAVAVAQREGETQVKEPKAPKGKDEVVKIKRSKSKKKGIETAASKVVDVDPSAPLPSATGQPTDETEDPVSDIITPKTASPPATISVSKKRSKKAGSHLVIPDFDYSKEGNLLDQTAIASAQAGDNGNGDDGEPSKKKKKKAKKEKKGDAPPPIMITTPDFGKIPRDMTQPKAGARSKTFTS